MNAMTGRFSIPALLFVAGFILLPARPAAADDKEKKPAATRPAISEEVIPLEAIAPVAKDGHKGEAFLRKPPGKGPFPAAVIIHGGQTFPTAALKKFALGTWPSRFLAAGYVVVMPTFRSRVADPQTRDSLEDILATVEYVRKLPYVDAKSIVVSGISSGGELALSVAVETDVAIVVPDEPFGMLFTGMVTKDAPKKGESLLSHFTRDPKRWRQLYTAECQKLTRDKVAKIRCPILIVQGDVFTVTVFNREILIPELRDLGKNVVVLTYPGEPHGFAFSDFATGLEKMPFGRKATRPFPEVSESVFEDVHALVRRYLPTKPNPIDAKLVKQVPFEEK
jgi:dipeptidyl aminopeptidase/acylaminoacyl peptidase